MTDIESRKRAQKRWYEANKSRILKMRAEYYQENKARLRKYGREYDKKRRSNKEQDTTKQNSLKAVLKQVLEELNQY
jgi:hypothetical protein